MTMKGGDNCVQFPVDAEELYIEVILWSFVVIKMLCVWLMRYKIIDLGFSCEVLCLFVCLIFLVVWLDRMIEEGK